MAGTDTPQQHRTHLRLPPEALLLHLLPRLLVLAHGPGRGVGQDQLLEHHAQPLLLLRRAEEHPQQARFRGQPLVPLLRQDGGEVLQDVGGRLAPLVRPGGVALDYLHLHR